MGRDEGDQDDVNIYIDGTGKCLTQEILTKYWILSLYQPLNRLNHFNCKGLIFKKAIRSLLIPRITFVDL